MSDPQFRQLPPCGHASAGPAPPEARQSRSGPVAEWGVRVEAADSGKIVRCVAGRTAPVERRARETGVGRRLHGQAETRSE
jgi:hypothetical protein